MRRSTETTISLLFFRILKVLGPRSKTRKGPSYGGVSGRRTASTRRKTWDTRLRDGGTWSGPREERLTGRRGCSHDMESLRSATKGTRSGEVGSRADCRRSPGSRSWQPKTTSAGQHRASSLIIVLRPSRTSGRWDIQEEVEEGPRDRETKRSLRVL